MNYKIPFALYLLQAGYNSTEVGKMLQETPVKIRKWKARYNSDRWDNSIRNMDKLLKLTIINVPRINAKATGDRLIYYNLLDDQLEGKQQFSFNIETIRFEKCYVCDQPGQPGNMERCNNHHVCCGYLSYYQRDIYKGEIDQGSTIECYFCLLKLYYGGFDYDIFDDLDEDIDYVIDQCIEQWHEDWDQVNTSSTTTNSEITNLQVVQPSSWNVLENYWKNLKSDDDDDEDDESEELETLEL